MEYEDLEDYEEFDSVSPEDEPIRQNDIQEDPDGTDTIVDNTPTKVDNDGFITSLLKSKGIEDSSKIKFEDENGEVSEVDWNTLSDEEKLNIINSESTHQDLDDSEIELINSIRESGLTPSEYLENLQKQSIDYYLSNSQTPQYNVDQYSDDELFIYDFISRMGNVTDEEAQEALQTAKSNEALFTKQMQAIRNEYKTLEDESNRQAQLEQQEQYQQQYDQFTNQIVNEINDFTDFSGYDLNLSDDDKDDLYEFITGTDKAGNNYFAKALSDPKILVQTAWFALNGKQVIEDITEYFQNEIKSVKKDSYKKGMEDAEKGKSSVVFKNIDKEPDDYTDLDEF